MRLVSGFGRDGEDGSAQRERTSRMMRRMSPPDNELPGALAVNAVLGRTDGLVVALIGAAAYSTGVSFQLSVRQRERDHSLHDGLFGGRRGRGGPGMLLLGVAFADGRVGTNVPGMRAVFDAELADDAPSLIPGGGGGDDSRQDVDYWLTPLPPAGDLTVVCAWPERGIAETRTVISGELIQLAAAQAVELWPWQPRRDDEPQAEPAPPLPDGWFTDVHKDPGADPDQP